jgi:hypothetical protein
MSKDFNNNWNAGDELIHFCGNIWKKAANSHTENRRPVTAKMNVMAAVRILGG